MLLTNDFRLEAGLCLYGNDLSEETTPVEAGLSWLVAKRRRETKDFPGSGKILEQLADGAKTKRVGLVLKDGPPARQGTVVFDVRGSEKLGTVTSGCPAPSLGKNIAMAYVPVEYSMPGTDVQLKVRDKLYGAVVTKMPFVRTKYYTKSK